jgi:hypothetical protein
MANFTSAGTIRQLLEILIGCVGLELIYETAKQEVYVCIKGIEDDKSGFTG